MVPIGQKKLNKTHDNNLLKKSLLNAIFNDLKQASS